MGNGRRLEEDGAAVAGTVTTAAGTRTATFDAKAAVRWLTSRGIERRGG